MISDMLGRCLAQHRSSSDRSFFLIAAMTKMLATALGRLRPAVGTAARDEPLGAHRPSAFFLIPEHADGERREPRPDPKVALRRRLIETSTMADLGSVVAPRRSASACSERNGPRSGLIRSLGAPHAVTDIAFASSSVASAATRLHAADALVAVWGAS